MGTHLRVLSKIHLMSTKKTRFRWVSEIFESLCFERKVASALEGLTYLHPGTCTAEPGCSWTSVGRCPHFRHNRADWSTGRSSNSCRHYRDHFGNISEIANKQDCHICLTKPCSTMITIALRQYLKAMFFLFSLYMCFVL